MDASVVAMWTNSESIAEEMPRMRYYIPHVFLHEFGHVLGLADLYKLTYRDFPGYLMDFDWERRFQSIPPLDNDYLEDIYRNHKRR